MSQKSEIVLLEPGQYNEWNRFVDESPQGDVFCYSWWLDTVTKSRFKIFAAVENGEIVAGMPLAYDKYGMVNEPFLTRTLGILYKSLEHISEYKKISSQRRWAEALLEKISMKEFVQTCTHHNFTDWLPYRWKGFNQTTRYTYIESYIDREPDNLKMRIQDACRSVINKAERNDIRVEESQNFEEFYDLVLQSYKRQGLKFRIALNDFKALDDAIKLNGKRIIMIARDKSGVNHAGTYIVYNSRSAYYLLSGSNPELRNLGGPTLALWESIKYFIDKVEYFNFGGSDIRHIETYIKEFGGILTPYFHIFNERRLHTLDMRYHIKTIFTHSLDIIESIRLRYLQTYKT